MSDARLKTIGELIDQLITADILCYMAQEKMANGKTDAEVADGAKRSQQHNARRTDLIRAINSMLGEEEGPHAKTYAGNHNSNNETG